MNKWVNMRENGYMNMEKWAECEEKFSLEKFRGCECTIGADLSAKLDLTSITFEFKSDDNYYIHSHSFMPEDRLRAKMLKDNVPYDLWAEQGWLSLTPGEVVDYSFVEQYIEDTVKEFSLAPKELCSDPWNALQFMTNMSEKGYTAVEIRQGVQTLGAPTKDFREKVYQKRVKHNGNPVLTWAMNNAVTREDANGNIMLDKSKATNRIDPAAATMNAHCRAMLDINTKSVYEERGLNWL